MSCSILLHTRNTELLHPGARASYEVLPVEDQAFGYHSQDFASEAGDYAIVVAAVVVATTVIRRDSLSQIGIVEVSFYIHTTYIVYRCSCSPGFFLITL